MRTTRGGVVLAEERPRSARRRWLTRLLVVVVVTGLGYAGYAGYQSLSASLGPATCQATAAGASVTFTPEQTANAALISALSVKRGLPPRAATIAIATSIQESKLRNLTFGDRDSVGLFQQRPSQGWGSREQLLDPVYATNKFYDALVKVKDYQTRTITQVAQEVQRSAFPEAYADHEQEGRILASTLTGQSPGGLGCRLDPATSAGDTARVVADLEAQLGAKASGQGGVLTVSGDSASGAWAVGAWAVARAEAYGIAQVQVGDRLWERSRGPAGWTWTAAPSAAATPTTVTIRHATP